MTERRLRELLDRMGELRLAVFGDACLDVYWHVNMRKSELSRETPHHNRPVVGERYSAGALANVAANLCALGVGSVSVFTVIGNDWRGDLLVNILNDMGADVSSVHREAARFTPAYIKPLLEGHQARQEASRFDFVNAHHPSPGCLEALFSELEKEIGEFDAVLLGDQVGGGVFTDELIAGFVDLAESNRRTWFTVDSRKRIEKFHSMVWKPNELEAVRALGFAEETDPEKLIQSLIGSESRMVYLTCGDSGCYLIREKETVHISAYPVSGAVDIVGAGDSFHAAMAAALAAGGEAAEAGRLGNLAASVTVRKTGVTGTADPDEVLAVYGEQELNRHKEIQPEN